MNAKKTSGAKAKYNWLTVERAEPPKRPAAHRISDFQQTQLPYDENTASEQAGRCIQCPDPICESACPLHAPLVELLRLTADRQFDEAAELLFATHHIPEIASHTCVGGRLCEAACILSGKSDAVPIRAITRFLLHYGWKHGLAEPAVEPSKNQSVAVIGSGIGGLVTADALSRKGYAITVFDSRQNPGGRMMNGLPGFRVDKQMVERRIELLKQRGIRFRMGVAFDGDVKLSELRNEFDAVFLGFGRAEAVPLEIPGAELRGVYEAYPFLTQAAAPFSAARREKFSADVRGKRVVVLGGGDTAMDALRLAIRHGASEALCIYRRNLASLPADAEEYINAQEEGARFLFLSQPVAIVGHTAGHVTAVRCVKMEPFDTDEQGRPDVRPLPGTEFEIPADVVFVAYGFTAPKLPPGDDFAKLSVDGRGQLIVDARRMTNLPGVFAGGSVVRGGAAPLSEVVSDARDAAAGIDRYLSPGR